MNGIKRIENLIYIVIFLLIINIFATIIKNNSVQTSQGINFDTSMFKTINLKDLESYINEENYKVLVIGKNNCEYTIEMLPILRQAQANYNYETLYVDQNSITEEDKNVLLRYDDETKFIEEYINTTPLIIVFKDNRMVDTWVGYQEYSVFEKFLTGLGIEKKEN